MQRSFQPAARRCIRAVSADTAFFGQAPLPWYPVAITQSGIRTDVEAPVHGVKRVRSPAKPLPCVRVRANIRVPGFALLHAGAGRIKGRRRTPAREARKVAPGGSARCSAPHTCVRACASAYATHARERTRARWRSRRGACLHACARRVFCALGALIRLRYFCIQTPIAGVAALRPVARVNPAWAHYRPAIPTVL
jgi:hypothetical protein